MYFQHRQGLWPVTWQTRPVVREDAPWRKNRTCLDYSQRLVMSPREAQRQDGLSDWPTDRPSDWLTGWLTDRQLQSDSDTLVASFHRCCFNCIDADSCAVQCLHDQCNYSSCAPESMLLVQNAEILGSDLSKPRRYELRHLNNYELERKVV